MLFRYIFNSLRELCLPQQGLRRVARPAHPQQDPAKGFRGSRTSMAHAQKHLYKCTIKLPSFSKPLIQFN